MELSLRVWVALAATLIGLTVAVITVVGVGYLQSGWDAQLATPEVAEPGPAEPPRRRAVTFRSGEVLETRQRIAELEQRLELKEQLVESKTEEIRQQREQMRQLRNSLAEAGEWINVLTAGQWEQAPPAEVEPPTESVGQRPLDLVLVDAEAAAREALDAEMSRVENELALAEAEELLLESRRRLVTLEAARRETLRLVGPAAVPGLVAALDSPRPSVRAWACLALADLGLDAMDALDALQLAANDPDPEVRRAAAAALMEVRN